ncbi:hypothetical protein TCAL_06132 [Tigriopus californicus]|uniref:BTB domain-containing protein n=1 Tax=Tigriopus californicus TaxID=6832 RepID=A0A553NYW8_TIGCA|nr:hypothetical protein TCAL_06132 [Tigriopus californicus]|eukprot:TCALIF_06132-PA protein Name:"Similar to ab Protein abrupt (Drosophila melanogaster)" AED:0.44 eAED:0.46 QI:0/0/0/0.5/1/1/2/0/707
MSSGSSPHHPSESGAFRPPPCKRKKLDEPNMLEEEQNQEQEEVTMLSRTLTRSGSSDYQRSDIEVSNIMKQWRHFRSDQRFTDLTVFCGPKGTKVKTTKLHRLILASCSEFLSELLREREEAVLILPDCDPADFLNLVEILYGERVCSHDTGYPSADLLQLLKITSFPLLDKGTPYADSGTESADAELGSLFQGQAHEDLFLNQNIEEALGTLNFEDPNLNLADVMREEALIPASTTLPTIGTTESNGPNRSASNQSLNTMGFSPNAFQSDSFSPNRKPSDNEPVPVLVSETGPEPVLVANPFSIAPPTPFMDRQAEQTNLPLSSRKRDGRPLGKGKPSSYVKSLQGDDSQSLPGATDWSDNESVCSDWSDNDDTLGWTDDEGGLSGKSGHRRNRSASSGRGVRSKSRESRSATRPQEPKEKLDRQPRKTSSEPPTSSIVPSVPEVIIDLSEDDPPASSQTNGEADGGYGALSEGGYDNDMNDVNILESSDMEFQLRLSVSSASVGSRDLRDCSNSLPSLPSRSSSVGSDLNDTFGDEDIISLPSQEVDVISFVIFSSQFGLTPVIQEQEGSTNPRRGNKIEPNILDRHYVSGSTIKGHTNTNTSTTAGATAGATATTTTGATTTTTRATTTTTTTTTRATTSTTKASETTTTANKTISTIFPKDDIIYKKALGYNFNQCPRVKKPETIPVICDGTTFKISQIFEAF